MKKSLCAVVSLAVIAAGAVEAATINVNSTADVIASDGACTLREAVISANEDSPPSGTAPGECSAGSGADVIQVPAGTYTLQIPGRQESFARQGDLDLRSNVTIRGAGASSTIINGNRIDRVFHGYTTSSTVSLIGMTITNGYSDDQAGGIWTRSKLFRLTDCVVAANDSDLEGGGIFVGCALNGGGDDPTCAPVLEVQGSEIIGNAAVGDGGGIYNRAYTPSAGIETVSLAYSTVSNNTSQGEGGGIYSEGLLLVSDSTVADNAASAFGGGIRNAKTGSAVVERSTINDNLSGTSGGGIQIAINAGLELLNSTVSGNSAANNGGGLYNAGTAVAKNVTFHANTAGNNGSASNNQGTLTFFNTILSGDCGGFNPVSSGGNLESPGDTCNLLMGSDQTGVTGGALHLSSLGDYGGPTETHRLLSPSAAIDMGVDGTCLATDQRGVARPIDGDGDMAAHCDIGAVEEAPCSGQPVLTLANQTITTTVTYTACVEIRLGPNLTIGSSADVTLNAGTRVVFDNDVEIGQNASVEVVVD